MKRVSFFVLSFCCAVVLIISAAAPAFAASVVEYFIADPSMPYSDSLPYGYNSIVVDVRVSSTRLRRFYLPPNALFMLYKPGTLYSQACFQVFVPAMLSDGGTPLTNRIYNQTVTNSYTFNAIEPIWLNNQVTNDYLYYELKLDASVTESTYEFYSNYSSYRNGSDTWQSSLKLYPSDSRSIVSRVNEAASSLNQEELSRYRAEMTQASQNHQQDMTQRSQQHAQDMTQRSQQHSEIMNAGADEPTLDTNNDWMDDSLSKVNGWLDDISGFEQQMIANKDENAQNMSQAASFLDSFFGSLPAAVIAAMALCLVVIVVVKIVGR